MARIRSIHPGTATDEAYMAMSIYCKAGWPLLWTECDDHGVFEWKPLVLKARIFPVDSINFEQLLAEWERLGCIQKATINGREYGIVRNFCKYQRPKKPSYRIALPNEFHTYIGLSAPSTEQVPHQLPTGAVKSPQMKEEGGKREEEKKETVEQTNSHRAVADATRPEALIWFEEFWKAFPPREGANPKHPALKAFLRATTVNRSLDQTIAGEITAAAGRYAAECRATNPPIIATRSVARALTWLNEKRWQDYPETVPSAHADSNRFHATALSPQLAAWDEYRQRTEGKTYPRDREGGWSFPSEWPPGYVPKAEAA